MKYLFVATTVTLAEIFVLFLVGYALINWVDWNSTTDIIGIIFILILCALLIPLTRRMWKLALTNI